MANITNTITKQDFLTLSQYSSTELHDLIHLAIQLKEESKSGTLKPYLKGKILGMIFEKSSTRTRVSFEAGMLKLGGSAIFLSKNDIQIGRGESSADTAKVLSRYVDGIMIRTFQHATIETYAENAAVPIINGLTDLHHPAQVAADLLTIYEYKGRWNGLKLAYFGDGDNNMCHSLIEGCVLSGMDMAIACPEGYEPNEAIFNLMKKQADNNGTQLLCGSDPAEAIQDADIVVTDVWTSMGKETESIERKQVFSPYQVNEELCQAAKEDYIFLHCLPAHRGEEVTAEIIDGKHSVVFDEAENRLHAQMAILKTLMGN